MKKQVLYIHGGDSYTNYDNFIQNLKSKPLNDLPFTEKRDIWTNTLSEKLGSDFEVFAPTMPNKQNARYAEWKIWLKRYFPYFKDGIVLVGWSLGGMFLLKYLTKEGFPVKVKAFYSLASPSGWFKVEDPTGGDCGEFRFSKETLKNIENKVEKINLWHSEDDFVVPYLDFKELKEVLPSAKTKTFVDKNHFLIEEFPELIQALKSEFDT